MKYCVFCGQILNDNDKFCINCGYSTEAGMYNQQYTEDQEALKEKDILDTCYRLTKWERLAWKISKIYIMISTFFFASLLALLILLLSLLDGVRGTLFVFYIMYFLFCLLFIFIPINIINGIFYRSRHDLMNTVYDDLEQSYKVYNNAGCIVVAILFGNVAAIFAIIHFAITKSNKEVIHRIIYKQTGRIVSEDY